MKTGIRQIAGLAGILLAATLTAQAQRIPEYTLTALHDSVRVDKGEVWLEFDIDLGKRPVCSQHKRIVIPVLSTPDGNHRTELPAVVVNGRKRAIVEQRNSPATDSETTAYLLLKHNDRRLEQPLHYTARIGYEPWMEQAYLGLREKVTGCACGDLLEQEKHVRNQLLYAPRIGLSAETACPVEYTPRKERRDAFLIYPVNKTVLHPDLYGNRQELAKIDSALQFVRRNPAYEIRSVEITGYASPEGSLAHNVKLAEGRAAALRNYLLRQYPLPDTLLTVTPGAENWDELLRILKDFQLPDKQEILDIIAAEPDLDRREARIRQVGTGAAYQTMLSVIYPMLRKNTFTISYISRERTPEEARRLVFDHPSELNVYEFYTVAHTFYADDPQTYNQVLRIAADTYPDHSIANNNAARACLQEGDTQKAEEYLNRTDNSPYTWSNRGYLHWLRGDLYEAQVWWKKAAGAGDTQARKNADEMERRGY